MRIFCSFNTIYKLLKLITNFLTRKEDFEKFPLSIVFVKMSFTSNWLFDRYFEAFLTRSVRRITVLPKSSNKVLYEKYIIYSSFETSNFSQSIIYSLLTDDAYMTWHPSSWKIIPEKKAIDCISVRLQVLLSYHCSSRINRRESQSLSFHLVRS